MQNLRWPACIKWALVRYDEMGDWSNFIPVLKNVINPYEDTIYYLPAMRLQLPPSRSATGYYLTYLTLFTRTP